MRRPPSWIPKAFGVAAIITLSVGMVEEGTLLSRYLLALSGALNSAALLWVRQDNVSSEQVKPQAGGGGGRTP